MRESSGEGRLLTAPLRSAVFLDRDGTLVVDQDYLSDPGRVELLPGAAAAVRRLRDAGFPVVVVTNQSGIARGRFGEADYQAVGARLDALLREQGTAVDATYHCPHHPDFTGPCRCRKPALGLYLRAAEELGLDLARSFYVGDKLSDVEPAAAVGGTGILVRTGYGAEEAGRAPEGVRVVEDLAAAAELVLSVDPPRRAG